MNSWWSVYLTEQLLPALGIDLPGSLTFFATGQISLQMAIPNYRRIKFAHPL